MGVVRRRIDEDWDETPRQYANAYRPYTSRCQICGRPNAMDLEWQGENVRWCINCTIDKSYEILDNHDYVLKQLRVERILMIIGALIGLGIGFLLTRFLQNNDFGNPGLEKAILIITPFVFASFISIVRKIKNEWTQGNFFANFIVIMGYILLAPMASTTRFLKLCGNIWQMRSLRRQLKKGIQTLEEQRNRR